EPGHIVKNCLSKKVGTLELQYKLVKQSNKEKEQNKNINLAIVESSKEDKGARNKKQSKSRKEEALQKRAKIQAQKESMPIEAEKITDPKPKRILKKYLLLV
ncbi:4618_t:CDS:2, partial [Gigaspora margarita]